jgi:hypothetical protein
MHIIGWLFFRDTKPEHSFLGWPFQFVLLPAFQIMSN